MLIESPDGQSALLGRPQSLRRRGPVLTCLSGFIEQGESIEEAVRTSCCCCRQSVVHRGRCVAVLHVKQASLSLMWMESWFWRKVQDGRRLTAWCCR